MNPATIACLEAEAALLGSLLLLGSAGAPVAAGLEPGDFGDPRHAAVFGALVELLAEGTPPDPVTVLGQLRRTGAERSLTSDRSAGAFLTDLLASAPAAVCAGHYRRVVVEHSARRRVVEAACRLDQLAGTAGLDVLAETVADELRTVLAAFERAGIVLGRPAWPREAVA